MDITFHYPRVIGREQAREAQALLNKYRAGKAKLDARLAENERWMRMGGASRKNGEQSAWLFNCLMNKHADAMDYYPEPCVLPREESDRATARLMSAVLPVILERNGYEQTYSDAWWYKLAMGTGVKAVYWDRACGGGRGDIAIRKMDLTCLFWAPGVSDIQDSPHFFSVALQRRDVLEREYPALRGRLPPCNTLVARACGDENVDTTDQCTVVDWYYKTNGKLHYAKLAGEEVLYASENEPAYAARGYYDHGLYPFVFDPLFYQEGSPAGFSYVDVMKGTQRYIDKLDENIMQSAMAATHPRFFVRLDGAVNEGEFADFSKPLIHVAGSLDEESIRQMTVQPIPEVYVRVLRDKVDELKETSGNRDFQQGGVTGGVTAASAIAALQESGSKLSRDMIRGAYRAYVHECYLVLELIRQFYDDKRTVRITGPRGESFRAVSNVPLRERMVTDASGRVTGTRKPLFDIVVRAQKASPCGRLAQNELAKELFAMGLFHPDMADQALMVLDMMDFDGRERLVGKIAQRAEQARAERQVTAQVLREEAARAPHTGKEQQI